MRSEYWPASVFIQEYDFLAERWLHVQIFSAGVSGRPTFLSEHL